ncbi:MAG TPA: LLM class flavin-dependent oxidoreductase [Stellaceae bacterium]|jgi:limonene 1,2-monooxygenase|nr:LLM class flavin-dependent oxidoreductase [Stellaceae bacterium]
MTEPYLRSGIFLAPFHNHDENPTLSMERDMELIEHLDRLNYHEAWIGEHHSGGFELIACPEMFIAAAAQRTRHIRLGTGVVSLPYHNPFMLADRMVQLDHMTRGRAMFGVGPGALVHDALKIGIDPGNQREMMEESFDVIIRLMRGEIVSKKTDWFNITDAQLQLRPYTRPTMELAVAAARSPSGGVLAGKHGVGMLSIGGTAPAQMERHTANWNLYEETARANGHTPNRKDWRVVGFFHIAETREQAIKNVQFGVQQFAQYFRDVATFPIIPGDVGDPVQWLMETGTACIGTPDDAVAYVDRLMKGSGGFGVLCELAQNWADWEATKRHYELMARFVHPKFQQSRELLVDSYNYATDHHVEFGGQAAAAIQKAIDRHAARTGADKKEAAE